METLRKLAVPLVVIALVTAAAITMFTGSDSKRLVAHFPRTISVYEGSEVRVLGVPIGAVESVEPSGTDVVVTMTYDSEVQLPADVRAGDLLAVAATGAYGRSMASNYNHVPRPPVVAVTDGSSRVLVRRETEDDLLALDLG